MRRLELLAPARNLQCGIAAIDCGADAVYIGAPSFGARKDAGNDIADIAELCRYAHQFGARIFVTFNIYIEKEEEDAVHSMMLECQMAGADAFIVRSPVVATWEDITIPLHASTQCAIRTAERAKELVAQGFARVIPERELSLKEVRAICEEAGCEVEAFVHGALCVCYSGECRLSEAIDGRSADRGECIQACRSLYDLCDSKGKVLVRNKALLSLKDLNLLTRLEDLIGAGVTSFKIEGRLKNESYVRNVTRAYSLALDSIVEKSGGELGRASFGKVSGGFEPNVDKTFNRGYTELFFDGIKSQWSCMNAPKSMGEFVGKVLKVKSGELLLDTKLALRNGDGFAYASGGKVEGFRGDVCEGKRIFCKVPAGLKEGTELFRNISSDFERQISAKPCKREIAVILKVAIDKKGNININAVSEDGREIDCPYNIDVEPARNVEQQQALISEQLSKRCGIYSFKVAEIVREAGTVPFLSMAIVNSMRRAVGDDLDRMPVKKVELPSGKRVVQGVQVSREFSPLMKSRYCIRHELGWCPKKKGGKVPDGQVPAMGENLFLVNNGKKFLLGFDCKNCEMTVEYCK